MTTTNLDEEFVSQHDFINDTSPPPQQQHESSVNKKNSSNLKKRSESSDRNNNKKKEVNLLDISIISYAYNNERIKQNRKRKN